MYNREIQILKSLYHAGEDGLTVKEIAEKIGYSTKTVRKWLTDTPQHYGLEGKGMVKALPGTPKRYIHSSHYRKPIADSEG